MAATSFEIENKKDLRRPPDYIQILLCQNVGTFPGLWYLNIQKKHLISCRMDLRGVSTRFDNPELEASNIEVVAYFPNGIGEDTSINPNQINIRELSGKRFVIRYQCGYYNSATDSNLSQFRYFFCDANEDNFIYKNNLLTIRGTDRVGLISQSTTGDLYQAIGGVTYDDNSYKAVHELIGKPLKTLLTPFFEDFTYRIKEDYPGMPHIFDKYAPYGIRTHLTFQDKGSYRKQIANYMNIFRGSDPTNPDPIAKRFVFRDAGIPGAGWCDTAVSEWARPSSSSQDVMPPMTTWELDYSEVADFEETYGNNIQLVTMDNPFIGINEGWHSEEIELVNNTTRIITLSEPATYGGWTTTSGSGQITVTGRLLSPYAIELKATSSSTANITCKGYIYGSQIQDRYIAGESNPNISISTDVYGSSVEMPKMTSLRKMEGYYCDWQWESYSEIVSHWVPISGVNLFERALNCTLNDCGVKSPKWITFTWRGHPDMQPRDMLIFTEKNGDKNYYEIDNLTLEHKDGGLISTVNAIYKCPYTE